MTELNESVQEVRPPRTLADHARRELELIEEEDDVIEWYLGVVEKFAEFGHSGASAEYTIRVLERLLRYQHISPITSDPTFWVQVGEGVWQSTRNSEFFSNDGGETFYSLSELEAAERAKNSINKNAQARIAANIGHNKRMKKKKKR